MESLKVNRTFLEGGTYMYVITQASLMTTAVIDTHGATCPISGVGTMSAQPQQLVLFLPTPVSL